MYNPKSFQQTDLPTLLTFMQAHNFAALVSQTTEGLTATHLPLMIDPARGEYGTLIGHMARANAQWKTMAQQEVLVMFTGPHTYISPNWYEVHPSVPTWNYTAVHAYGTPHIVDDPKTVEAMLEQLVNYHEANFPQPWGMDLPEDYMHKMLQSLVAFEIPITRLEGKYKLSQNRSETDQTRVAEALAESTYGPDRDVAALMQANKSSI